MTVSSAPSVTPGGTRHIRDFAVSKLGWIKRQQKKITALVSANRPANTSTARAIMSGANCICSKWSRKMRRRRWTSGTATSFFKFAPAVATRGERLRWMKRYRIQLKSAVPPLIARWEPVLRVKVERFFVRRRKTKWGELQSYFREHPAQYRPSQETQGVSRIHRGP